MIKEKEIKEHKSRRTRRGNRKPFLPLIKGFRRGSRSVRLLDEFSKILNGDKKEGQCEWIMKNIKSVNDVLGWSGMNQSKYFTSLKNVDISMVRKLLNQDDLMKRF